MSDAIVIGEHTSAFHYIFYSNYNKKWSQWGQWILDATRSDHGEPLKSISRPVGHGRRSDWQRCGNRD
jgi:hypothetical protein